MSNRTSSFALALLAGLLFSMVTPFTRLAIDSGALPGTVITLRYVCMALGCALALLLARRSWSMRFDPRAFVLTSAGWLAISFGHLGAVRFLPVSLSAIIFYTFPLMILVWRRVVDGQRFSLVQIAAFVVAFIGIAIALGPSVENLDWRGVALALIGAVGSAAFIIGNEAMPSENDPITTTFWLCACNLPIALALTLLVEGWETPGTGTGWIATLALGFGSVAAMFVLVVAIRRLGAAMAGLVLNIEPVSIIVLAALLVGEVLTTPKLVGMGLVVVALVSVGLRPVGRNST